MDIILGASSCALFGGGLGGGNERGGRELRLFGGEVSMVGPKNRDGTEILNKKKKSCGGKESRRGGRKNLEARQHT